MARAWLVAAAAAAGAVAAAVAEPNATKVAQLRANVKNVIILMQENRAYDHYAGMLQGVRGFADRAAHPLPSGMSSFYQPVSSNLTEYMLPFHVDAMTTSAMCMDAPVRAGGGGGGSRGGRGGRLRPGRIPAHPRSRPDELATP
jgi:phospholipase C